MPPEIGSNQRKKKEKHAHPGVKKKTPGGLVTRTQSEGPKKEKKGSRQSPTGESLGRDEWEGLYV